MAEITNNHGIGESHNKMGVPGIAAPSTTDGVVKQAKDVASNVSGQAKDLASQVVHQAKDMVTSQVAHQQEKSAGDLKDVAKALRQTSKQLDGSAVSPYVDKAADQVEKVSQFLRTTNVNEIKGTVESFARREPLLFLGGAFVVGILGARFLKSSSHAIQSGPAAAAGTGANFPRPFSTQPGGMGRP